MEKESEVINQRFIELMKRDPLVTDFVNRKDTTTDASTLMSAIQIKWNLAFFTYDPSGSGIFHIQKVLPPVQEHIPARLVSDAQTPFYIQDSVGDRFIKEQDHLYLNIDLSALDMNDAKEIKRQVWELVRSRLQKYKVPKGQKPLQAQPRNDPQELAFVYHASDETFTNYLRWYDIHINEKISFRLIAVIEKLRKQNPGSAEELLNKFIHEKIKWGSPVKEEDAIREGVKKIHQAIHRAAYSQSKIEAVDQEWNCPDKDKKNHNPLKCGYCKDWYDRFDRIYSMDKGYMESFEPEAVEIILSPYPKKHKKNRLLD